MQIPELPIWMTLRSILFFESSIHVRAFLRDDHAYLVSAFGAGLDLPSAFAACIASGESQRIRRERPRFTPRLAALEIPELDL